MATIVVYSRGTEVIKLMFNEFLIWYACDIRDSLCWCNLREMFTMSRIE